MLPEKQAILAALTRVLSIVVSLTALMPTPVLSQDEEPALTAEQAGQARADRTGRSRFTVPPAPDALEPVLSGAISLGFSVPLANGDLCPAGAECVFSGGGGVSAQIERRWPSGPAIGLSYELGFVNSNGVFQLGLLQELRGQARYYFLLRSQLHPFIGGGVGAVIFGDTFRVATAGVSLTAFAGLEWELTELLSIFAQLPFRVARFGAFTTERDGVRRASRGGFTVTGALHIGLAITQIP